MRAKLIVVAVVVVCAVVTTWSGIHLERTVGTEHRSKSLLLLPNGKHLKIVSLGQAPLLAELMYIWAIQYYSEYEREDRFRYVQHIFGDVIAVLDPQMVGTRAEQRLCGLFPVPATPPTLDKRPSIEPQARIVVRAQRELEAHPRIARSRGRNPQTAVPANRK